MIHAEADVLVVGGGMAGAIAALSARAAGARVVLVRRAPGATALSSGAVSVAPDRHAGEPLVARRGALEVARRIASSRPDHPYAIAGVEALGDALAFACAELRDVLLPPLERPRFLATPFGSVAGVATCQPSMAAGDLLAVRGTLAVVGLRGHLAFDAAFVAAGLARWTAAGGPPVVALELDLPRLVPPLARPHEIAAALEVDGVAEEVGEALRRALPPGAGAALLPPVLGLSPAARVAERLGAAAGVPVAETLSDVPSVPGLRLQRALEARLVAAGVEVRGGDVSAAGPDAAVEVGGGAVRARAWVLATGRFVGGGIARRGVLVEPALRLPVQAAEGREAGVHLAARPAESLTVRDRRAAQPLLSAGLRVDGALRPVDERGRPVHPRLFAAGAVIGGHEHATDGTGLGVALLTGFLAGAAAARATR